jgi:hypothetical protein
MRIDYPHIKILQNEHRVVVGGETNKVPNYQILFVKSETESIDISSVISNVTVTIPVGDIVKVIIECPMPVIENSYNSVPAEQKN